MRDTSTIATNDTLARIAALDQLPAQIQHVPYDIPNVGRDDLAKLFHTLGFTVGVEVGVEQGLYSEVLCRENPGVKLYCVDAWKAYRGYRDHVDQKKLDRFFKATAERLAPYPKAELVRMFSVEAAATFSDGTLDFVYLDGNHNFQNVAADLAAWTPKLRAGGILAGHDYVLHRWPNQIHVVQTVKGWTDAYEIRPWFILGSKEEIEGQVRDKARSFFWVHEPRPVLKRGEKPIHQ